MPQYGNYIDFGAATSNLVNAINMRRQIKDANAERERRRILQEREDAAYQRGQGFQGTLSKFLQPYMAAREQMAQPVTDTAPITPGKFSPMTPTGPRLPQYKPVDVQPTMEDALQRTMADYPLESIQMAAQLPKADYEQIDQSKDIYSKNPSTGELKLVKQGTPALTPNTFTDEKRDVWTIYHDKNGNEVKRVLQGRGPEPSSYMAQGNFDPKLIAEGIKLGDLPPDPSGYTRGQWGLIATAMRKYNPEYNLSEAKTDWNGVQKFVASANNVTQLKLRQSIDFATDAIPVLHNLYDDWKKVGTSSGFKLLNKGALATMKNLPGEAGAAAQALDTEISDITDALAQVYMGGNSPTDKALGLAMQNLNSDWNEETFNKALKLLDTNLGIRKSTIANSMPMQISEGSPYIPKSKQGAQGSPAPGQQTTQRRTFSPDDEADYQSYLKIHNAPDTPANAEAFAQQVGIQ